MLKGKFTSLFERTPKLPAAAKSLAFTGTEVSNFNGGTSHHPSDKDELIK